MERKTQILISFPVFLVFCILVFACDERPIVAIWGLRRISFQSNGGTAVPSQNVLRDQTIRRPKDPTRANFKFVDWYEDDGSFLEPWDFNTVPETDMTLYANWRDYGLTLSSLDVMDFGNVERGYSSILPEARNLKNTTDDDMTAVTVSLSGANAASFEIKSANTFPLASQDNIDIEISPKDNLFIGIHTATVTISGGGYTTGFDVRFEVTPGTVTGLSITVSPNLNYKHDETLDLSAMEIKLTYSGGFEEPVSFSQFASKSIITTFQDNTPVTHGMKLIRGTPAAGTAGTDKHNGESIKVIHTPSGSNAFTTPLDIDKAEGVSVGKPSVNTVTTTASVIHVNTVTTPSNGQAVEYILYEDSSPYSSWQAGTSFVGSYSNSATFYVYARSAENYNYEAGLTASQSDAINFYTVIYDSNGGTGTPPSPEIEVNNKSITLPDAGDLEKIGEIFAGWNTANDGTGTNYAAGSSYTVTGDVTLYAKWMKEAESLITITIDIATIADPNVTGIPTDIVLKKSGTAAEQQRTITVTNATEFTNISWEIVGVGVYNTGTPIVLNTGDSVTLNANTPSYGTVDSHILMLKFEYDNIDYMKNIRFKIED